MKKMKFEGFFSKERFTFRQVVGMLAASVVAVSAIAYATTVTIPHTFTAGQTAVANDVNANFQALADAINNRAPATLSNMAGTWVGSESGSYIDNSNPIFSLCTYVTTETLTLNANGTFSTTASSNKTSCQAYTDALYHPAAYSSGPLYNLTGTWTVSSNGSGTITSTIPPWNGVAFRVSRNLDILVISVSGDSATGTATFVRQ